MSLDAALPAASRGLLWMSTERRDPEVDRHEHFEEEEVRVLRRSCSPCELRGEHSLNLSSSVTAVSCLLFRALLSLLLRPCIYLKATSNSVQFIFSIKQQTLDTVTLPSVMDVADLCSCDLFCDGSTLWAVLSLGGES
jgi:hypothetical protein